MNTKIRLPGLPDADNDTLNRLLDQLRQKARRNLLRASYYDGKRAVHQIGSVIPPQYARLGLVLGWSAKAVDTLARRCNLDGFIWPDGELGDVGYRELVDANYLDAEVSSGLISSLINGVSFMVATGGAAPGEPEALVHARDALAATGTWNSRTRQLDDFISVSKWDGTEPTELTFYLPQRTYTAIKDGGAWTVDRSDHFFGVPAYPLVYKPRAGRPFGTSRISRVVMSHHDAALRIVTRMEGHADVYSFPEMWLLGADESLFKNADGSQKAAWQVMLGRLKAIPDDEDAAEPRADVKQFSASSPEPHIAQLRQQAQLFSGETSIPISSLGVSDQSNPISEGSYIASREDLIAEAEGSTDDWSPSLRRCILHALAIQNGLKEIPAEWSTIAPKWRSPLYLSRAAQADAGSKQLAAAPWLAETGIGLELLGLTEQQIQVAMSERRRQGGSAALQAIAEAASAGRPVVTGGDPDR